MPRPTVAASLAMDDLDPWATSICTVAGEKLRHSRFHVRIVAYPDFWMSAWAMRAKEMNAPTNTYKRLFCYFGMNVIVCL
jgi:hypothetical protein